MKVAHFTSELAGGAGIAAQRLHDALRMQDVESCLYYETGSPLVGGCQPAGVGTSSLMLGDSQ